MIHAHKLRPLHAKGDLPTRWLWALCIAAAAAKIILCAFQLIYASPNLSPIDDTLMVDLAKNISAGEWLGPYNWLTLSKHSFFALWLAFLNALHLNYLIGGQLLFAGACFVLLAALKPAFQTNWGRLWAFGIVLLTPATWAESSLRVYRDNIYPALVLLMMAGFAGAFLRYRATPMRAVPFYIAAGFGMGGCWLCHEDNLLLVPFLACALIAYLLFVIFTLSDRREKLAKLALAVVPFVLWGGCLAAWCGMNYRYYGRFIISDFTSSEFSDAMGAMGRACPEDQTRYVLIPNSTRQTLYEVSPTLATIRPYLETDEIYNGYGSVEHKEINSGGVHWAIRKAAALAGYYQDAQTSEVFYRAVADEINAACDAGSLPCGAKRSGTFAAFKPEYFAPTMQKFGEQIKLMALFEQTRPTALLSIATPEQSEDWENYLHCVSTKAAVENTNTAYFAPINTMAYKVLNLATWVQRIAVWPMLVLTLLWLCQTVAATVDGIKKKAMPNDLLAAILLLGFGLTALLRMAAVAYLMAVSFSIDSYLMYLSAACPLMLCFISFGAVRWLERRFVAE